MPSLYIHQRVLPNHYTCHIRLKTGCQIASLFLKDARNQIKKKKIQKIETGMSCLRIAQTLRLFSLSICTHFSSYSPVRHFAESESTDDTFCKIVTYSQRTVETKK